MPASESTAVTYRLPETWPDFRNTCQALRFEVMRYVVALQNDEDLNGEPISRLRVPEMLFINDRVMPVVVLVRFKREHGERLEYTAVTALQYLLCKLEKIYRRVTAKHGDKCVCQECDYSDSDREL